MPRQRRHRQPHGVTGAALLGLLDDGDGAGAEAREQRRLDGLVLVAEHGDHGIGAERARELDRIADQRPAQQLVQHLGARRAHARPLARREHDRGERDLLLAVPRIAHRVAEVNHERSTRRERRAKLRGRMAGYVSNRRERRGAAAPDRRGAARGRLRAAAETEAAWAKRSVGTRAARRRRRRHAARPTATVSRWPRSCARRPRRAPPRSSSSPAPTGGSATAPRRGGGSRRPTTCRRRSTSRGSRRGVAELAARGSADASVDVDLDRRPVTPPPVPKESLRDPGPAARAPRRRAQRQDPGRRSRRRRAAGHAEAHAVRPPAPAPLREARHRLAAAAARHDQEDRRLRRTAIRCRCARTCSARCLGRSCSRSSSSPARCWPSRSAACRRRSATRARSWSRWGRCRLSTWSARWSSRWRRSCSRCSPGATASSCSRPAMRAGRTRRARAIAGGD